MRLGGRLSAAIEVLTDILERRTPATLALRDWGKANRYAGSKDRSAVGNLVFDALRHRSSTGWKMDDDSIRALVLGSAVYDGDMDVEALLNAAEETHGPGAITDNERERLANPRSFDGAPGWIAADIPEWCWPAFENNFGDEAVVEGQALSLRPPLDLRANTLKSGLANALTAMAEHNPVACDTSPIGLRIPPPTGAGRLPNLQATPAYLMGEIEIQDEGSQIVSLLIDAQPGEQVLDFCAGGGGKTLAMAATMKNAGTVHAYDIDGRRLAPLIPRAHRAGATNVEVHMPPADGLKALIGKMDRVVIDAPCTGTGTWRRKPDAKWRLSLDQLQIRMKEQAQVLEQAKEYVRAGGLIFYITCSVIAEENENSVYNFLEANPDFTLLSAGEVYEDTYGTDKSKPWSEDGLTVTLTPASTNTDGFFFAVMEKAA